MSAVRVTMLRLVATLVQVSYPAVLHSRVTDFTEQCLLLGMRMVMCFGKVEVCKWQAFWSPVKEAHKV